LTIRTRDHELVVGSTKKTLTLARESNGQALYSVTEELKNRTIVDFEQTNWIDGHGQLVRDNPFKYIEGQSIDTTQDGRVILGPLINEAGLYNTHAELDAAPTKFLWFKAIGKLMMATGSQVYWYDGTYWVSQETITGKTISDMAEYNSVLYVAIGSSDKYYTSTDGSTFTQTDLTDGYAVKFLVAPNAAGTANVLWKSKNPNEIASTTNGVAGGTQWTSPAYIGDTTNNITNIFLASNKLFIGKTDNLYFYDANGGVHALMDDLKMSQTAKNFQYVTDWQSATYFSKGNGLGEISSYNTFDMVGPLDIKDDIGKVGNIVGLTSDVNFIYCAVDEGTNTHIYKGREQRNAAGNLTWSWCPWVFIGTNAISTISVIQHTATDRRLWFGYGVKTGYVTITDNPTTDSNARFCPSGWLRMSYTYGDNPYWDKMFQSVITETKSCAAGVTVTPKYRKDTDTSASALTATITTNGVVKTALSTPLSSNKISFELWLATNSSAATPEVLYFLARGNEKPESFRVHECTYLVDDEPARRVSTLRTYLRGARTNTSLIKFADLRYGGSTSGTVDVDYVNVVCEPGYPQEVEIIQEGSRQPQLGIKMVWREVH